MKRSKMIEIIAYELDDFYYNSNGYNENNSLESASLLLTRLEECGMLPPYSQPTGIKDEFECHIQNCIWEPEDS